MGLTAYRCCLGMLVILLTGSLVRPGYAQTADQPVAGAPDQPEFEAPLDPSIHLEGQTPNGTVALYIRSI